ncbi:MAG: Rrf2 family transcriptional regulator, partial [Raoultibacter sp.]
SVRGPRGGYILSGSAVDLKIGDILRAVEGSCAPVACLEEGFGECPRRKECETIGFWEGLDCVIENYVDGKVLAELVTEK